MSVFLLDPRVRYQCRILKSVRFILSVGRQDFFPTNSDFLSAATTARVITNYNTCIFSKFHFPIISAKEIRGLKFSEKLNSNKD